MAIMTERNFEANYMGNLRLIIVFMFILLPFISDISSPSSQFLVNSRDPRAKINQLEQNLHHLKLVCTYLYPSCRVQILFMLH